MERTRVGRITSGTSALVVVGGFLSCFPFTPFSGFRGARRSVMTFCYVFDASRKYCAPVLSAGSLLGSFQQDFLCVFPSGTVFLGFWRAAVLPFRTADPQNHKFVPAGATRPPTRQRIGSPSRFFPPLCGRFPDDFLVLFRIFRNYVIS